MTLETSRYSSILEKEEGWGRDQSKSGWIIWIKVFFNKERTAVDLKPTGTIKEEREELRSPQGGEE